MSLDQPEKDPYTFPLYGPTFEGAFRHLLWKGNEPGANWSVDRFISEVRDLINGEHGAVVLRCQENCFGGDYYEPPAPEEDCPVHGRSYANLWEYAGNLNEELGKARQQVRDWREVVTNAASVMATLTTKYQAAIATMTAQEVAEAIGNDLNDLSDSLMRLADKP